MQSSAHTEKMIVCASIKNLQIKLLLSSPTKVVYFKKHLAYQIRNPQKAKFPLPLNVPYHCQIIKPANGTKVQPLHIWLNNILKIKSIWFKKQKIIDLTSTEYFNLVYQDSWALVPLDPSKITGSFKSYSEKYFVWKKQIKYLQLLCK